MNADNLPNQVSYDEVCTISGKLYIESQYEINRLRSILLELQKAKTKVEAELAETKKEIIVLKKVHSNANSS